ncbi:USP31 protein [Cryptosporidium ryanae]|uniref:USP31 protein n=1 Tax=Cryptosporidium ryanae TaxID=515981 RepID=UPI003519F700|nr:USP31 protein [Cryptosporidium ryanae]
MTLEHNRKDKLNKRIKTNEHIKAQSNDKNDIEVTGNWSTNENLNVSLKSLYIYNLYNPQLVLLDCNVQLNPFGCYMISENAPRSTKGIWKKNVLKEWFGIDNENVSKLFTINEIDSQLSVLETNKNNSTSSRKYVYSGIKNLGATCYMGSYLQYLFMNLDFRSRFLNINSSFFDSSNANNSVSKRSSGSKNASYLYLSSSRSNSNSSGLIEGESSLSSMTVSNINLNKESSLEDNTTRSEMDKNNGRINYERNKHNFDVIVELQKIFRQMETGDISVVNPLSFAKALGISTENQEDATEFAVLLLSLLEAKIQQLSTYLNEINDKISLNKVFNFIPDLFRGKLNYSIECISCKSKTLIEDHFYELRLQILFDKVKDDRENGDKTSSLISESKLEQNNNFKLRNKNKKNSSLASSNNSDREKFDANLDVNSNSGVSGNCNIIGNGNVLKIEQAFDNFFNQELLSEENQYMCDKCQCKRDAVKSCLITELPPYLHVCLQRYCYDSVSKARKKVSVPVDFPQILDLKNYCSRDNPTLNSEKVSDSTPPNSSHSFEYEFIGILEHQGQSAMSGHYTASLKDFQYFEDEVNANFRDNYDEKNLNTDSVEYHSKVFSETGYSNNSKKESLQFKDENNNNFLTYEAESKLKSNKINLINTYDDNNKAPYIDKMGIEEGMNTNQSILPTRRKRVRKPNSLKYTICNPASKEDAITRSIDSKIYKEESNISKIQNIVTEDTNSYSRVSPLSPILNRNDLHSNSKSLELIKNYRLAQMLLNNGGINGNSSNSCVEGNIVSTPTPLLTTPILTPQISPLTPMNALCTLNTTGNNLNNSNLIQNHNKQEQFYNNIIYTNHNSLGEQPQSQLIFSQPNLPIQQISNENNQSCFPFIKKITNSVNLNRCINEEHTEIISVSGKAEVNEANNVNCINHHFSEEDSSATLINSSQGSTIVIPQSQNSESQNSISSYSTHIMSQNNIFNGYVSNTNCHVLGPGGQTIGTSQGAVNYFQYLNFLNSQQNIIGGVSGGEQVFGRMIGDSGGNNYLSQIYSQLQNQNNNNMYNLIENKYSLINFQNSNEKGLKGGISAKNEKSGTHKNRTTKNCKLSVLKNNKHKEELPLKSRIRWKWVHFDDTEVQEWVPKYSLNNTNSNRIVTRTGYMLIYKRKDWKPELLLDEKEKNKYGGNHIDSSTSNINKSKKTNRNETQVQNVKLNAIICRNEEKNHEDITLKKLSLLNLRKQNITYLKNVILRPCIENWREKWIEKLELYKDDDEKLTKDYLFSGFIAIPSDWWLSYVHGDDLEKILRYETGSYINFWDYSNLYCKHFVNGCDYNHGFLDPFLFWEGKIKLFPPELIEGLEECIKNENCLLKNYYDSLNNCNIVSNHKIRNESIDKRYMNLHSSICNRCVSSLHNILDISLKQSRVILDIMNSNTHNEKDVCLISTRMMNSLITKFDLKHKNNSNIAFFGSKSSQVEVNEGFDKKFSLTGNRDEDHNLMKYDFNWKSMFLDIKKDIQKNQDYIIKHASLKDEDVIARINDSFSRTSNRTQDWSKEISLGSSKCPHGSFIKSKINTKTAMLVPTKLLDKFISFEEERSREISSFILSSYNEENINTVISSICKGYLRYKCTNKLVPCMHCNI